MSVGEDGLPQVPPHFRAVRLLGRGSTAVTWLAHYEVTGQDVALKVWRSGFVDDAERERFVNECRWHRLLDGEPGVVGWIWASEPDLEHPWTATQPHGLALTEYLRRYRITAAEAVQLGLDLLDGLSAVHRRGLVHRDVNPNNVLVDDGGAALCDFGLAMPVDGTTLDRSAGTPGFVAPELDAELPSFRSDVYSAAQTIARMLGPDVPAAVDHLVTAVAGSQRPGDRPADATEFAGRLRAATQQYLRPATPVAAPVATSSSVVTPAPATVRTPTPPEPTAMSLPAAMSVPGATGIPAGPGRSRRPRRTSAAAASAVAAVAAVVLTAGAVLWAVSGDRGRGDGGAASGPRVLIPVTTGVPVTTSPRPVATSARPASITASPASITASPATASGKAETTRGPGTPSAGTGAATGGGRTTAPTTRSTTAPPTTAGSTTAPPTTAASTTVTVQPTQAPTTSAVSFGGADIGPGDEPVLGPARAAGRCDGRLRSTEDLSGVGSITVYAESGSTLCAKFIKASGKLWNVRTYLALSLCTTQGGCDTDWNLYSQDAGPVRVSASSGCVRWRMSATDVDGKTWLLRDRTGSSGC